MLRALNQDLGAFMPEEISFKVFCFKVFQTCFATLQGASPHVFPLEILSWIGSRFAEQSTGEHQVPALNLIILVL